MSCTETRESAIICHIPRDRQLHCSLVHLSGNKNRTQTSYPDVGTAPISGHIRKIESELLCKYFHLNFDAQIKDTCVDLTFVDLNYRYQCLLPSQKV